MPAGQGPSGPGAGVRRAALLFSAPGAPVYARQLKQGHNARSMPGLKGGAAPGRPCGGEHRGKFQKEMQDSRQCLPLQGRLHSSLRGREIKKGWLKAKKL